jgi:phosphocarrier protein
MADGREPADEPAGDPPVSSLPVRRIVTIVNERGLHARAAAKFVTTAEKYGAIIEVAREGEIVAARSIMGLMMLGAGRGAQIELIAEGWDAREALDALSSLVEAGFNEQD